MPKGKAICKVVVRTERGYGGHFILAFRCLFRRNTLLTCGRTRIVVSTVGSMLSKSGLKIEEIGCARYYETMAFRATKNKEVYWEADVTKQVSFGSPWSINECAYESDMKADAMHEAVVDELTEKMVKGLRI